MEGKEGREKKGRKGPGRRRGKEGRGREGRVIPLRMKILATSLCHVPVFIEISKQIILIYFTVSYLHHYSFFYTKRYGIIKF